MKYCCNLCLIVCNAIACIVYRCPGLAASPESGCIVDDGNNKVQYPDCCPRAVCPETSPAKA